MTCLSLLASKFHDDKLAIIVRVIAGNPPHRSIFVVIQSILFSSESLYVPIYDSADTTEHVRQEIYPTKKETHTVAFSNFLGNNNTFSYFIYTILYCVNRVVYPMKEKNKAGSFFNVTECLVNDMASVSSHTGSATVTNRTNNGSDVVLGDRRPFKTQRSDPLKTWSYIMIRISCWPR